MNSRPFEEQDLPEIAGWFADLNWPLPPIADILPPIGCVVEDEEGLLACGWLYTTGTSLAFLSWTATNPARDQADRELATEKLILSIQHVVRVNDKIKSIMVLSRPGAFLNKLKSLNFRTKPGFDLCTWIVKT
jgi:hypothetical protein